MSLPLDFNGYVPPLYLSPQSSLDLVCRALLIHEPSLPGQPISDSRLANTAWNAVLWAFLVFFIYGGGVCGAVLRVVQPRTEPVQAQTVKLDHNSDCQIRP